MPRIANILILCANKQTVDSYKGLKILQDFCANTAVPGCKYWEEINIYYTGEKLLSTTNIPTGTIDENGDRQINTWTMKLPRNPGTSKSGTIPIFHQLFSDEVSNLKTKMITEILPKFFDVIINENCPRQDNSTGFAITPAELTNLINGSLKLDGYYIDKAGAENIFGRAGFQNIYDPFNTGEGLLEKIEPNFRVNVEVRGGTEWVAYKLRRDSSENLAKGIKKHKKSKKHKKFCKTTK